jgi:transcriptional regulator with XRE-family HTH domain
MSDTEITSALLVELGARIKMIRLAKGVSQVELSIICQMEKSSLSKIESGKVNVSYLTLHRLSKGLEISIVELCS